ncbi:MAG: glycosyltransferase family 4 protein, partial [Actinobacteria bacterium]|nr:glycosyltransferase family 4 protein [Actinomycetota bacterium]
MLAPLAWRTPPLHYGPWEQFASLLTEGLVACGHHVTLFASGDSVTAATLHATSPHGWSDDASIEPKVAECVHIASVFERAGDFDIIHNGFDFLPLTYSGLVDTPVVTTIHGFSSPRIVPVYERYDATTSYVAISDSDRHPRLHYAATVHHGIDTGSFALDPAPGDHLLYFGRIHPDKGTAHAIEVAHRTGRRLDIAG